jgi:hypothetical protein
MGSGHRLVDTRSFRVDDLVRVTAAARNSGRGECVPYCRRQPQCEGATTRPASVSVLAVVSAIAPATSAVTPATLADLM